MIHYAGLVLRNARFSSKTDAELQLAVRTALTMSGVTYVQRFVGGRRGGDIVIKGKTALLVTLSPGSAALLRHVIGCARHPDVSRIVVATLARSPVDLPHEVNGKVVDVLRLKSSQPGGE